MTEGPLLEPQGVDVGGVHLPPVHSAESSQIIGYLFARSQLVNTSCSEVGINT